MSGELTIAFAYGASEDTAETVRPAFEANIRRPFLWAPVDWRPTCLPAPDPARLDFLASRFDLPREPDDALPDGAFIEPEPVFETDTFINVQGESVIDIEGVSIPDEGVVLEPGGGETTIVIDGFEPGRHEMITLGPGDLIRFILDRRAFIRDVYIEGVKEVGVTVADTVNYLDGRSRITDCVAGLLTDILEAAPGPVAFVGESLGGIMLVDALGRMKERGAALDKACVLITFASQSSALVDLRPAGSPTPPTPFSPWANVWHRDDLMSYPIAYSYEGPGRRDHEARHRTLFPEVHATYISDPKSRLFDFINYELDAHCG